MEGLRQGKTARNGFSEFSILLSFAPDGANGVDDNFAGKPAACGVGGVSMRYWPVRPDPMVTFFLNDPAAGLDDGGGDAASMHEVGIGRVYDSIQWFTRQVALDDLQGAWI